MNTPQMLKKVQPKGERIAATQKSLGDWSKKKHRALMLPRTEKIIRRDLRYAIVLFKI